MSRYLVNFVGSLSVEANEIVVRESENGRVEVVMQSSRLFTGLGATADMTPTVVTVNGYMLKSIERTSNKMVINSQLSKNPLPSEEKRSKMIEKLNNFINQ